MSKMEAESVAQLVRAVVSAGTSFDPDRCLHDGD
jgi:hypothetical protein